MGQIDPGKYGEVIGFFQEKGTAVWLMENLQIHFPYRHTPVQ